MALEKKKPTLLQALTPLIALALLLSIGYGVYGLRAEILLLVATSVAGLIAIMLGYSYREIERGIIENMMKGIPLSQAAGAIVAGAYFGDKLSPFSDTTNLAPIAAQSNLFDHIRHTLWTTTPAWLLGLAVYLVIGLTAESTATGVDDLTRSITATIESQFTFHWLLLLPAVITLGAAVLKLPVILSMLASSAVAVMFAMVFQQSSLVDGVAVMVHGFEIETSNEILDRASSARWLVA